MDANAAIGISHDSYARVGGAPYAYAQVTLPSDTKAEGVLVYARYPGTAVTRPPKSSSASSEAQIHKVEPLGTIDCCDPWVVANPASLREPIEDLLIPGFAYQVERQDKFAIRRRTAFISLTSPGSARNGNSGFFGPLETIYFHNQP